MAVFFNFFHPFPVELLKFKLQLDRFSSFQNFGIGRATRAMYLKLRGAGSAGEESGFFRHIQ